MIEESLYPEARESQEAGFNSRIEHQRGRAGILSLAPFATDIFLLHDHCVL